MRGLVATMGLCAVLAGCQTEPRPRTTPPKQSPAAVEIRTIERPKPAATPGFAYCCGNQRFKLEIRCDERMMRCYERRAGQWTQTYGRHCKRALDTDCYLHACDRVCDGE